MKQTRFKVAVLPIVLTLSVIAFFSCKKDISVPQKSTTTTGVKPVTVLSDLTAVVDGDSFISVSSKAVLSDSGFVISGVEASGNRIELVIKDNEPGVYKLGRGSKHYATYKEGSFQTFTCDSARGGGQIRITGMDTVNKIVSGVFSYQAIRSSDKAERNVTGGDFRMNYEVAIQPDINENDTVYSTNPSAAISEMSAIVGTDTIQFKHTVSFMYLGYLHLSGYNDNNERITIAINPNTPAGNVSLEGNFGPNSAYYQSPTPNSITYAAVAGQGDFTITTNDKSKKRIIGTFSFQGKVTGGTNTKSINNGKLDIYY